MPMVKRSRVPADATESSLLVDPAWLGKAALAVLALAACLAYLTYCGLFFFAQWQFVLHPSRVVRSDPAALGIQFQPVRFGDDLSGQPQLTGWWMPSDLPTDPTVLMLHGEDGSMSEALPVARALHDARLNVLLFDYRGYGRSGGRHPTERLMRGDARSALDYLTGTRGIAATSILVYGQGLGASLAVSLCREHPELPALILNSADGDTLSRVRRDVRTRILPVSLLFHERFPLADPLSRLQTPKLLISFTRGGPPEEALRAADPKTTLELPPGMPAEALTAPVRRFVGTYVKHPPGVL